MERSGHKVRSAPDGRDALTAILARIPDLTILDMFMAQMDGGGLLEGLRSYLRLKSLPVIVLTGLPDSPLVERVRFLKVNSILVKWKATFDTSSKRFKKSYPGHRGSGLAARCTSATHWEKNDTMRLADFILANIEPILAEWEVFARSIWPGAATDPATLRDHAEDILRATAQDMTSEQTARQQSDKSKGDGDAGAESVRVDKASTLHGAGRVQSGFDLLAVASEYRALRATVIRLWRESAPHPDARDLDDLIRFNESIDQSLAEAARTYTEAVDRSRQMFLGILSHDLRGPLHAIITSAKVLSLTAKLDVESSEVLSGVSASAVAMARMINDLLDFTGAGLGAAMPLSPAAMDLESLCNEVVEETRAAHPTGKVRFQARGDLTGEWDAGRLRQVLSNLLGNAVQHGGDTVPVELSASDEGSHVRLAICNGGPPIPPDALPTIFDPLVRVSSPESQKQRRHGSIGLGLYIAREVAVAHGGDIEVTSSKAAGTTFTVRLPRRRADR